MNERLGVFLYSMGPGGAERVVSILLPELLRHYDVTLILMNETLFHPVPEGVEIVWLERSRPDESGMAKLLKLPLLAWRFRKLCRLYGIDKVFSLMNRPNYVAVLGRMMGGAYGLAISERGTPSMQYAGNAFSARISRWLIRTLYPKADLVTTNSQGAARDLVERFGVPASKLVVIHNPFDLEAIKKACRASDKRAENGFTFISVGRLDEGKNHALLIDAFARVYEPGMRLRIIGEGPLRETLQKKIEKLDLVDAVTLEGAKKNPFACLAEADAFVFASRHEGFPNVLVEALACGLPVVSTDCPSGPREILGLSLREDVPPGCSRRAPFGLLVPVDDTAAMGTAMKEVYNNEILRKELASAAPRRAAEFSKERQVGNVLAVLERLPH